MTFLQLFCFFAFWGSTFWADQAQGNAPQDITNTHQKALTLTVYPHNLGLVQDVRDVPVLEGDTPLFIYGIAPHLLEESLLMRSLDKTPLLLKEQSFYSTPLTAHNLLEKSIGQPVNVLVSPSGSSEKKSLPARLLGVFGEKALVDFGQQIESVPADHIAFLKVPSSLSLYPSIHALIQSPQKKSTPLEITYLTKGLSWEVRYTVDIHAQKNNLNMVGWVTLKNTSGMDFLNGKIQLAAPSKNPELQTLSASPYIEPLTYALPFPVTLPEGTSKTVSFVAARDISVNKSYRIYLPHSLATSREETLLLLPVQTWLSFNNTLENGFGMPLPAGKIKIYARNQQDTPLFVGETKTEHIPSKEAISFPLGVSSTIKAETQQTDFRRLGEKVVESAYRVDLTNPQAQSTTILLIQKVSGNWHLLQKSHPPQFMSGDEIHWSLTLPAHQTISLRYRIRLTH